MAKAKTPSLVGKTVRINADLLDLRGEPHPQAGKTATLVSKNSKSYLASCEGDATAVLRPEDFTLEDDAAAPASPAPIAHALLDPRAIAESPFNPRKTFDPAKLAELAESIKAVGILQPILVRPVGKGFEAVFGHRRLRAAILAGVRPIPAMVQALSDSQAARLQALENLQREDLDPIEEAQGYLDLITVHCLTKQDMAEHIGKSRTHIYSQLKLLDLCFEARELVRQGLLPKELAIEVARLPIVGPLNQMAALAKLFHGKLEGATKDTPVMSYRQGRDMLAQKFRPDSQTTPKAQKSPAEPKDKRADACTYAALSDKEIKALTAMCQAVPAEVWYSGVATQLIRKYEALRRAGQRPTATTNVKPATSKAAP